MTVAEIYDLYYPADDALRQLLWRHSQDVARVALEVADSHPELSLNRSILLDGALLHDIGICRCDAPGIHCHGSESYMQHGPLGAAMLRSLPDADARTEMLARICERHTGTGLPGYEPETLEEQVVCYADKFFSKSHPERQRNAEQTAAMLSRFGDASVERFMEWHYRFG